MKSAKKNHANIFAKNSKPVFYLNFGEKKVIKNVGEAKEKDE